MKVGDLVLYIEGGRRDQVGLIINGPERRCMINQWEVFWMYRNMTGWWDEHRLETICESG
ncbi:MAG TPA: hypothetical protein EYG51_22215 [Pseudomonadales bacterium]|nr:hypothetical protein [Pseudomonadales bacterium]